MIRIITPTVDSTIVEVIVSVGSMIAAGNFLKTASRISSPIGYMPLLLRHKVNTCRCLTVSSMLQMESAGHKFPSTAGRLLKSRLIVGTIVVKDQTR